MAGGLIQLVAVGIQDLFLIRDPQITFFKIVYRRHTNFSTEVVQQKFNSKPNFGQKVTCEISRNADLLGKMYLVVVLPQIPMFKDEHGNINHIMKFAWVRRIGFALIKTIEIEIANELIDRQYGDWMNIWYELTVPRNKNQDNMLGDVRELTDFTNGKKSYMLMIPLQFWFNRFPGLALPIVSLQHSSVKLNLELNNFENCSIITPTNYISIDNDFVNFEPDEYIVQGDLNSDCYALGKFSHFDIITKKLYYWKLSYNSFTSQSEIIGVTSEFEATPKCDSIERIYKNRIYKNRIYNDSTCVSLGNQPNHFTVACNNHNVNLRKVFLLSEYIYLDDEERHRFHKAKHEYLIEQLQYNGEKVIDGTGQSFELGFSHPCKELFWVTQLSLALDSKINDLFNYTNSLTNKGRNMILRETLLFNGLERVGLRDSEYFDHIQPYQVHENSPAKGINIYSFALHPENHQPSGTANMTKIDNILLKLLLTPDINVKNSARLRVYALNYNVLRIAYGISGLVFSNDRPL